VEVGIDLQEQEGKANIAGYSVLEANNKECFFIIYQ
jgi:hypothetical protein